MRTDIFMLEPFNCPKCNTKLKEDGYMVLPEDGDTYLRIFCPNCDYKRLD